MKNRRRSTHYRRRLAVVASVLAVVMLAAPAGTAGESGVLDALQTVTEDPILDVDAKPAFDWTVPERYGASWTAWNRYAATYRSNFVSPIGGWSMDINACASRSVRRIVGYTLKFQQLGTTWTHTTHSTKCTIQVRNVLPAQGYYRATLTLHTTGPPLGVSVPLAKTVSVRDYLIVSLGDSLASGEGNPDRPGTYVTHDDLKGEITSADPLSPVRWKDSRCHRSAKAGPALAAEAIERADSKSSVTFLSFACSGAELRHLTTDGYRGSDPTDAERLALPQLPPQAKAVANLVGPSSLGGGRQIDALLVSAGVNDLGFGGIVERCAANFNLPIDHESCVTEGGIADAVNDLQRRYAYLALGLSGLLPRTREIYFNNYPSEVFRNGACGKLGKTGFGIDTAEAAEMSIWGTKLNHRITEETNRYRSDAYRWNQVADLTAPFFSHAYCDTGSWFTSYERSWETQGNKSGTAHPNAAGHIEYGKILRRAIVLQQGTTPYRRLTVTIDSIKAATDSAIPVRNVSLTLWRDQSDHYPETRYVQVPNNGQWTAVPAATGTFTLDVFAAPASPRHAVSLYMSVDSILPIKGTRADGFGAGTHEFTHPTQRLAVRYRVNAVSPADPGQVVVRP